MARRDHRNRVTLLLALVALLACARARAADSQEAKDLFRQGVEALRASDYPAAAQAFLRSYELSPRPAPLCNLAVTYDRWPGHEAEAIDAYDRCADADTSGRLRDHARERAADLRARTPIAPPPKPPAKLEPAPPAEAKPTPPPVVKPTPPAKPTSSPPEPPHPSAARPLYKAWWLWTGVAVVTVAGAVVLGVELGTRASGSSPSLGSFGPGLTLRY